MDVYPPINAVSPKTIFGTRVPRDGEREFPGVSQSDTHQLRAVYEFSEITANIIPEFERQSDGSWRAHWVVQVYQGRFGSDEGEYGPFESVADAVSHIESALSKLAQK